MESHGYGRIKGRGNRYAHFYNDIMLNYMVKEQLNFDSNNVDPMWGFTKPSEYKLHSLTALRKAVIRHVKSEVSWDTIIDHVNDLVNNHILIRNSKHGSNNETYYRLSKTKLRTQMMTIIAKRLITRNGTIVERITDTICYTRPPGYYFYYFHPFPWSKIDVPASCLGFL
jgi:hypothetical protein